jgi:hypothetical protein
MSRMRGQWFDDPEDPEFPEEGLVLPPLPAVPPRTERGRWLARDSLDDVVVGPGDAPRPVVEVETGPRAVVPTPKWTGPAAGLAGVMFFLLGMIAIVGNVNVAKALVVAPVLAWIAYTMAKRFAVADGQPAIVPILMGGLCVKFVGVLVRYWIGLQVYGRSDATEYIDAGRRIAPGLRHGHLIEMGRLRGTNFVRLITGIVFAITPASPLVGFLVFGFFAYIGMIFFWRAYRQSISSKRDLRYLQVLMLLPSLAFWPSSIGKDSWMVMGVGIAAYGASNIFANRTVVGWLTFITGISAVLAVRPHVGIAVFGGLVIAELFRSRGSQGAGRAALSIVLLFFIGGIVMSAAASFLGISDWSKASVDQELASTTDRTSEGRSEFSPTPVNSPVQFPIGAFTVLLRPMPYESHSPQELATAIEDLAILGFCIYSFPRLSANFKRSRRRPYLLFGFGVLTIFIVEYSSFSNFALLARQRTQVAALFLVFLCMPREEVVEVDAPQVRVGGMGSPQKRAPE